MPGKQPTVFVSYAHEDADAAEKLYLNLKNAGANPWLDIKDLEPGTDWKNAISRKIKECRYFIAILSTNSVEKKGYVQKEVAQALDMLDEFPESSIYIIPIRLNDCQPSHEKLKDLHWADMFPNWEIGLAKILITLRLMAIDKSNITINSNLALHDIQKAPPYNPMYAYAAKQGEFSQNLAMLEGIWHSPSTMSYMYIRAINGKLYAPYCYKGNDHLTGIQYGWKNMDGFWHANFCWFDSDIKGFILYQHVSNKELRYDWLYGRWWANQVSNLEYLDKSYEWSQGGTSLDFKKIPNGEIPKWASGYFEKVEKGEY